MDAFDKLSRHVQFKWFLKGGGLGGALFLCVVRTGFGEESTIFIKKKYLKIRYQCLIDVTDYRPMSSGRL